MKRLFFSLLLLLLGFFYLPHAAYAGTTPPLPKWHGPPCNGFAVCSIDPPGWQTYFLSPCYTSIEATSKISPSDLSSVGFCEAARAMLVAPAQERDNAYATLTYWYEKLVAYLKVAKGGLPQNISVELFIIEMQYFESNWQAYKAAPSATTWLPVENTLGNFGQFAEVLN